MKITTTLELKGTHKIGSNKVQHHFTDVIFIPTHTNTYTHTHEVDEHTHTHTHT